MINAYPKWKRVVLSINDKIKLFDRDPPAAFKASKTLASLIVYDLFENLKEILVHFFGFLVVRVLEVNLILNSWANCFQAKATLRDWSAKYELICEEVKYISLLSLSREQWRSCTSKLVTSLAKSSQSRLDT